MGVVLKYQLPSPGVMYIVAVLLVAFAEKYALGTNVIISSVPGNSGKQLACVVVGTTAPDAARAEV